MQFEAGEVGVGVRGNLAALLAVVDGPGELQADEPACFGRPAAGVTQAQGAADEQRWSRMDAFVGGRLEVTGTPGAALAVIERDRVVHEQGFGKDGRGATVTSDTPFLWGSVSKPITGLAVMQLVEAGRVEPDAPVRTYLPWFRPADRDVSDRITVRQLLINTSGIPASATIEIQDRYDNGPGALADAVRDLARIAPAAEPGESYAYSSAGYAVLGALVEEVSGQPFGDYLHAKILDPLGMEHAVATERDHARERVAPGHRFVLGRPAPFEAPYDTSGVPAAHWAAACGTWRVSSSPSSAADRWTATGCSRRRGSPRLSAAMSAVTSTGSVSAGRSALSKARASAWCGSPDRCPATTPWSSCFPTATEP